MSLQLVVDGLCNKAIASRLGIALGTVKTHLKAIFDKLGVATRTQAVITVARRGLLQKSARGRETDASGVRSGSTPIRVPETLSAPTTRHGATDEAHFREAVSC